MYPRVKVQEQHAPNSLQEETSKLILRVIESLSPDGHYPLNVPASKPGKNCKSSSSLPRSGISSARLPNLSTPSICTGSEGRSGKSPDDDKKPNIRASSVPRPRAVLSSPDNDNMIGHRNRLLREKGRLLKGQPLKDSASGQCKPTLKNARMQSPVNTRETNRGTSNTNHLKAKPLLRHEKPLRQTPRKGKPNPVWI